jgi:hypothetical protein
VKKRSGNENNWKVWFFVLLAVNSLMTGYLVYDKVFSSRSEFGIGLSPNQVLSPLLPPGWDCEQAGPPSTTCREVTEVGGSPEKSELRCIQCTVNNACDEVIHVGPAYNCCDWGCPAGSDRGCCGPYGTLPYGPSGLD